MVAMNMLDVVQEVLLPGHTKRYNCAKTCLSMASSHTTESIDVYRMQNNCKYVKPSAAIETDLCE